MKINLLNTSSGLKPMTDEDFEQKSKLKLGQVYCAEIKLIRNYEFHKKYFALINCAYEYLTESQQEFIKTKENFRKTLQIAAGWSDVYYSLKRKEWVEESKSISFESMKEEEFETLYNSVKDVLFSTFLRNISQAEFEKNLVHF